MDTILVDTSVWVNFLKGNTTRSVLFLKNNIENFIVATCPTVVQEVLQGVITDKEYKRLHQYFNSLMHLSGDQYIIAIEAAQLYRNLRKQGVTIRKPNDCLIAAFALHYKIPLLHDDRDFDFIGLLSDLIVLPT